MTEFEDSHIKFQPGEAVACKTAISVVFLGVQGSPLKGARAGGGTHSHSDIRDKCALTLGTNAPN